MALAVFCPPAGAQSVLLDGFAYPSADAARKAWQPSSSTPAVTPAPGGRGLVFPCRFAKDGDRVYWDRAVSFDLSRQTSIRLDFSCDDTTALRSPMLYLKSGGGWYAARIPMRGSGRRQVYLAKTDFTTEDKPLGWHRIERIRISAWKADGRDTQLTLHELRAEADVVLVVRNTLSSAAPAEKRYGAKVAARVSRWLADAGIPHGVVTDEEVVHGGLMKSRIALLTYHPNPPAREIESLKLFVQKGGKLVVFYGADPALAALMGVKLGEYRKAGAPGAWSTMTFMKPSYWNVPERVYQQSYNIMEAAPADRSAQVIAYWEDARGRRTDDPAWIATRNGLWMTHVLLDDDAEGKQSLLTGLLASLDETVWTHAARHAVEHTGQIDSFRGFDDAWRGLSAAAEASPQGDRVRDPLKRANRDYREMLSLFSAGRYREVVFKSRTVRRALIDAYAYAQAPKAGEFRGVWDHEGTGWFPGDWDRTCRILEEHGVNAVFPNVFWGGLAHYPSRVLPQSSTVAQYGDQLAQCIEAASRRGIGVHAWKVCWNIDNAPVEFRERMRKQGRLQVSHDGTTTQWLCPSHPDNVALEINAIREVVAGYAVDGIHLDYVRYPSASFCYCPTCRRAFEKDTGRNIARWPADVRPKGKHYDAYQQWRADRITAFVRAVREHVRSLNANVKVSAAVWGAYPATVDSIGQDWGLWLKQRHVDFVCPMNYSTDNTRFVELTRDQLALPGAKGRVYPGLGITADESQLTADHAIEQIILLRRLGAQGFMLFDMSQTLRLDTLPALQKGLTAQ